MSETVEPKSDGVAHEIEAEKGDHRETQAYDLDANAKIADYKADAVEAENMEHNMTVLEAVRQYPMAAFWAFVMSFTIVSCLQPFPLGLPPKKARPTLCLDYGVL